MSYENYPVTASEPGDLVPEAPGFVPSAEQIQLLQEVLAQMPQAHLPIKHHFSKGVYVRECFHPAGVTVVGCRHKTEHLFILASGDITITTDDGMQRLQGFHVLNTTPGMKRAAHAWVDSVIFTVHVTNLTDPAEIERQITEDEPGSPLKPARLGEQNP